LVGCVDDKAFTWRRIILNFERDQLPFSNRRRNKMSWHAAPPEAGKQEIEPPPEIHEAP